jgi:hypothetical protein
LLQSSIAEVPDRSETMAPSSLPLAAAKEDQDWPTRCMRELHRLQPSLTEEELRFLTNALMNSAGRLPPEQAAWFGWIVFLGDHLTPRIGA